MSRPSLLALSRNTHRSLRAERVQQGFAAVAARDEKALLAALGAGLDAGAVRPDPSLLSIAAVTRSSFSSSARAGEPLLLAAAAALKKNDLTLLRLLLSRGAPPDACDQEGRTVFHALASARADEEAVRLLVAAGAPWRKLDRRGRTPLHALATSKDTGPVLPAHVSPWLALGLTLNDRDREGRTPLEAALGEAGVIPGTVEALLDAGSPWTPYAVSRVRASASSPAWTSVLSRLQAFELAKVLPPSRVRAFRGRL